MLTPFEILADYESRSLAHSVGVPEQIEATGLWRGITFQLGRRVMVSSINEINEILPFPQLTKVPGTRFWLLGVANVRGNLVSVVDLRAYIEGEKTECNDRSRVLLVKQMGSSMGILVDEILGQRSFNDSNAMLSMTEQDPRYAQFIPKFFDWNGTPYRVFSMSALIRARDFMQTAV